MNNEFTKLPEDTQKAVIAAAEELLGGEAAENPPGIPKSAELNEDCQRGNPDGRLYSFDDMGNAQRFIDLFGEDARYNYTAKKWLCWNGKYWRPDEDGEAERMTDIAVESMKREAEYYEVQDEEAAKAFAKHMKSSRSNKSKGNMLREAQHRLPIMPHELDSHPFAFNTPSGIVSLKNGKILPHERKYFITKIAGTEIADTAGCPVWKRFLNDIFGGDADLIRYIQKAVGYSLTGSISEQCMFILLGDGHNGKSTFLEAIRGILGDYCSNMQAETIMMKSFGGGINSDIARLNKARMVTSSEPNEGVRLNEGLIKQITGGDAVTARKLFENEFEFRPEFKLWLAANHKPIVRGTDTGIWRRLHVIPFNVRIPPEKADKGLEGKLRKEYPAILKWAVEGCILWQTEGLQMPKAVLDMVKEYRREMDVISAFVEEKCECGETLYARASALYAAYSEWCEKNNEYHMSNTKFAAEMSKRFTKIKRPDGLYYCGIKNI